jgi:hypothetical protein
MCIRSYYDAYHGYPELMLFDLDTDPHEQCNRAAERPDLVAHALGVLGEWGAGALGRSPSGVDPLWTVLRDGGPWHSRVDGDWYLERLRATGRGQWADRFAMAGDPMIDVFDQVFLNPSTPSELR